MPRAAVPMAKGEKMRRTSSAPSSTGAYYSITSAHFLTVSAPDFQCLQNILPSTEYIIEYLAITAYSSTTRECCAARPQNPRQLGAIEAINGIKTNKYFKPSIDHSNLGTIVLQASASICKTKKPTRCLSRLVFLFQAFFRRCPLYLFSAACYQLPISSHGYSQISTQPSSCFSTFTQTHSTRSTRVN